MANTTVKGAQAIHGQNPQFLVEYIIRSRIYESTYWKEHCFALTGMSILLFFLIKRAETIIDKAIALRAIGGVYGNQKPTEFICLLLKLLQIQPEKEILVEYLLVDEFKYLRALAAMYIRMTFRAAEVYDLLEPLLKDYRKLRLRSMGKHLPSLLILCQIVYEHNLAGYSLTYVDEFVDQLLTEERVCDIILPRLIKREVLEDMGEVRPRKSLLLDAIEGKDSHKLDERSRSRSRSSSRSRGSVNIVSGPGSDRSLSRSPARSTSDALSYRSRSRSISPDRMNDS
ncbi:hypothetical protein Clacol_006690 [Clathrus columnatus]|uniref:Pre-mRNA-splicing factor 38 n=1 Tax=Clathrus columnatus TaxID=1419009 RepID=A0AAV5AIC6_9AGAM|nr:hypothetical protein Clacol_006690 [Clathrus columnatus]